MLTSHELRQKYLDFFKSKDHAIISSASLIPENDPTVLFTTAGMHPLVPYLMGEKHAEGTRLTDVQKCVRTGDIDEVGDIGHLTFFEMLGNWSLGDYFKEEAIEMSWEFLTSKEYLGLDPKKLAVTVFEGDDDAPFDEESKQKWLSLGVPEHKIAALPKKDNWWGPAGQTGPCGPDSEMFYWVGESEFPDESSNPGTDEDNWLEIWNDVFMQYTKQKDGLFIQSTQKNVDTGMGLERTVTVLNGFSDVYQIDTMKPLVEKIEEISGKKYGEDEEILMSMRVIVDHVRTASMIMADDLGVAPSNVDQGYVVRKLIRRVIRHGKKLGIEQNFCVDMAKRVIEIFADVYPEVKRNQDFVLREMENEENKFRQTLEQGIKEFEKLLKGFAMALEKTGNKITEISGKQAFKLYDTYGFPLEMTQELAQENDLTVDEKGFNDAFKKHKNLSREGAEQKFKGGLADHGEMSTKYHTATHLLHDALRKVLGSHVAQKGSNITADRLRFDFTHGEKMTDEEKKKVEDIVNNAISKKLAISMEEMTVEEAKDQGAIGLFGDKYGEKVKVYSIGAGDDIASKEICGGPHVENLNDMGHFRIKKEESSSAGIRRIKAILE
ncbi:alanine--tRNA ligase [Candidatus Parcubacteria bacterium]|nr:MAG: alanine--tRNA ligase [Candidatus Parcubacteria bacterium]